MAITLGNQAPGASQSLERLQQRSATASERLAAGRHVLSAEDSAALLSIADGLERDARLASQAARNANDALSAARIGDQALGGLSGTLSRLSELAEAAANGTVSPEQRQALQKEFDQLRQEIDRVSNATEFNGVHLLRGGATVAAELGDAHGSAPTGFETVEATASALGVADASLATPDAARAALAALTGAIDSVNTARAGLGAAQSRLAAGIRAKLVEGEQSQAAASRIADTDVAAESAVSVAAQISIRSNVAIQAQANLDARQVLRLLSN